ncbi:DFP2-like protein 25 [Sarcoptes scabiei]|uniref:DFP2-like protein 25 n=1 Tax=Sarcoptes scabiei TaxID=52283 RepID=A0A132A7I3_SARSC|nr:DFP2-like protein 25 [Sarcoptes scabiei]
MQSYTFCLVLFIVPAALAINPLSKDATQITLHDLLVSHGIRDGQMALVMVAPLSPQQALEASAGTLQSQLVNRPLLVQSPAQAVNVHYKSQSAPLNVQHTHIPAPKPELQLSRSEEEPHRLVHEIIRPVIQDVREIIQPYRRIVQEIRPVQETVVQKIAKNANSPHVH